MTLGVKLNNLVINKHIGKNISFVEEEIWQITGHSSYLMDISISEDIT